MRATVYQHRIPSLYVKRAHPQSFKRGDLVLIRVTQNTKVPSHGSFRANWEEPYRVDRHVRTGYVTWTKRLESTFGTLWFYESEAPLECCNATKVLLARGQSLNLYLLTLSISFNTLHVCNVVSHEEYPRYPKIVNRKF